MTSKDTERCDKCEKIFSCKNHFKTHVRSIGSCYSYKVQYDLQKGRYLVASRTITPGEVISRESATVVGPCTRSKPQCLQCFKHISSGKRFDCLGCGFPMCDKECMEGDLHREECLVFRKTGFQAEVGGSDVWDRQYSAITVLRLLRCMNQEDGNSDEPTDATGLTSSMEDHDEDRRVKEAETWQFQKKLIVDFIQQECAMGSCYSEDQIRRATGVLMTNATSLQLPAYGYGVGIGLYPVYAMGNHSCISNTKTFITPDHHLEMRALTRIEAGQEITNQYMAADKPTFIRRAYLRENWFFDCQCARCSDPTECGSHLSTILCSGAKCGGAVVPANPLDQQTSWVCMECETTLCRERVESILECADELLGIPKVETYDVVEHFEKVIHQLSPLLHPNNHLMINVKQKLALLYGNIPQYTLAGMSRPAKQRKMQCCQDVMDCMSKVELGVTTLQVKLMNEVVKTKDVIAKEDFQAGLIDKKCFQSVLLRNKLQLLQLAFQQSKLAYKSKSSGTS